jgi:hypothetical protein
MEPFLSRFTSVALRETISLTLRGGEPGDPVGEFAFVEFYCTDPACDCRRVVLQVWAKGDPKLVRATINFGWEPEEFYLKTFPNPNDVRDIVDASLDPLNRQSGDSAYFLNFFREHVRGNPRYRERFKRHYELFKNAVRPNKSARR